MSKKMNNNKQKINNNNNYIIKEKEKKNIDILEVNNIPKQSGKTIKCNSVNNLIGININVNYMNKNYSINKIKPSSYMTNIKMYCTGIKAIRQLNFANLLDYRAKLR